MRARLIPVSKFHRKDHKIVHQAIRDDDSFDARDKWPGKILPVRDQGACGSCWAFAVAETTGDRVGIEGLESAVYSPQDLVSCDNKGDDEGVSFFV
jgi:C1A family cysteine protease